ncbi:unnamed protein product [Mytilus coruscus]|uniref:Uncharacterized protein n=1 Tax=Mytilus coruscus TaxID=42192 RepID=A0A6J8AGB1_MYTCO|nr:unnamed protein product [Mytilus coruscus]
MGCVFSKTPNVDNPCLMNGNQTSDHNNLWRTLHDFIVQNDTKSCLKLLNSQNLDLNIIHKDCSSFEDESEEYISRTLKFSPLHLACLLRRAKLVEIFCKYGSDVNIRDKFGRTAINICIQYWPRTHPGEINAEDRVAIHFRNTMKALCECSEKSLQVLLRYGADPCEEIDIFGNTLLHFCAQKGLQEPFLTLKEAGSNIEYRNRYGMTPLLFGATFGPEIMTEYMISLGSNKNTRDTFGNGLIHCLVQNQQVSEKFIESFIDEISPDDKNACGKTALMFAAKIGDGYKIAMLLRKGADASLKDVYGKLALFYFLDNNEPVHSIIGYHSLLVYTPQICVYDNQGYIAVKLTGPHLRHVRKILEAESLTPTSLYRLCIYKMYCLVIQKQGSEEILKIIILNCPNKLITDIITFRKFMSQYWSSIWSGIEMKGIS